MLDSVKESRRVFKGTEAERDAMRSGTLEVGDEFWASEGSQAMWSGSSWYEYQNRGASFFKSQPDFTGTTAQIATIVAGYSTTVGVGATFYDVTRAAAGQYPYLIWNGTSVVEDTVGVHNQKLNSGEDQDNDTQYVRLGRNAPVEFAASAAAGVCGSVGAAGDYLDFIIFPITTTTDVCTITDGSKTVTFPAGSLGYYPMHWPAATASGFTVDNSAQDGSNIICFGEFT